MCVVKEFKNRFVQLDHKRFAHNRPFGAKNTITRMNRNSNDMTQFANKAISKTIEKVGVMWRFTRRFCGMMDVVECV